MAKNNGYTAGELAGKAANTATSLGEKGKAIGDSAIHNNQSDDYQDADQQFENASQEAGDAAGQAKNTAQDVVEAPARIADTAENIKEGAEKTVQNIKNAPKKIKKLGENIKNLPQNIKKAGQNAKEAIKNPKKIVDGIKKAAKNLGQGVKNAIKKSPQAIFNRLTRRIRRTIKIVRKLIQLAVKAVKAAAQLLKALTQVLAKVISFLVSTPVGWCILLVAAILVIIVLLSNYFMDNASTTGDLITDTESLSELNETDLDADQNVVQVDISSGSKIISAYYTYYSTKSLWVVFDGSIYNCHTDETSTDTSVVSSKLPKETVTIDGKSYEVFTPVQYGSKEFIEIFQYDPFTGSGMTVSGQVLLQDKYERESSFYLAAEAIASIDKTLNHGQFRYPEQIVQKVKYKVVIDDESAGTYHFELDQLADEYNDLYTKDVYDEDGNLLHGATLSTAYTQNESATKAKYSSANHNGLWIPYVDSSGKVTKRVPGVWDYGFGSILHYLKYIEAHENRGEVVEFQVLNEGIWDLENDEETGYQSHDITTQSISGTYGDYLSATTETFDLYKQAKVENYTYAEWNALDATEQAKFFAGEGADDPTSSSFNKKRVYGLADTTSYMIDWVVTAAGTVTTEIQTKWEDSGVPFKITENDGSNDFTGTGYENNSDYNNTDTNVTYQDEEINVQVVEHKTDGTASFVWDSSCVNLTNGTLTVNPTTDVYIIRYEPTGSSDVDSKFSYTSFTEGETTGNYIKKSSISMFNSDGTCKNCGKYAITSYCVQYNHSTCFARTIQVPVEGTYISGKGWTEYVNYGLMYNGQFVVNTSTGAITSNPYAIIPTSYNRTTGKFELPEWSVQYLFDSNGICRTCGGAACSGMIYTMVDHSNCCTVDYEYDVIKVDSVKVSDKDWGLPSGYIQLTRTVEGTKWDKEPAYNGDPDTSEITGKKYYVDYFSNYSTFVPKTVQNDFDFEEIKNQTGLDEDDLLALLERENVRSTVSTLSHDGYFVDEPVIDEDGTVRGYVGPGFGLVTFETGGLPVTEADCRERIEKGTILRPNAVTVLAAEGWPNYGCCQMNKETLEGFCSWMLMNVDREELWNKIFEGTVLDISSDSTPFSEAWKNSHKTLSEDEYITWMLYQLAYMYECKGLSDEDALDRYNLRWRKYRATQELFFACANNGALNIALNQASFTSRKDAVAIINGVCDSYSTNISFGGYTDTMRNKYNVYIRQFYTVMAEYELPVFEWDESKGTFASEGSGSGGGWSLKNLWIALTGAKTDADGKLYYPWNKIFKNSQVKIQEYTTSSGVVVMGSTDANAAIERVRVSNNAVVSEDIDYEIAKIFASVDKVPVSTYQPVTDSFFVTKYQSLFSSDLNQKWGTNLSGLSKYLPDGWSGVFTKSSKSTNANETDYSDIEYTLLNEFDKQESPILKTLVVYGGTDDSKKVPISIHSVSKGTVLEIGGDIELGGTYIAIQYKNSVVYYGGITVSSSLAEGDAVGQKALIGEMSSGSILYLAMKTSANGSYVDPTNLLKGGLDEIVELAREYLGFDYEWGGHGPTGCFPCCSTTDHMSKVNGVSWGFDCSGLVNYVFNSSGYDIGICSAQGYSEIGEDVTELYQSNGQIDWDAVPAGTIVFFDWDRNGHNDHVGIWSGNGSLIHAHGSNPWGDDNVTVVDATQNHAVHGMMVVEYFIGAVPAGTKPSQYAEDNNLSVLYGNKFNNSYQPYVTCLKDFSMYKND